MVTGIGTDILKISRLGSVILNENDPFMKQTYTANEMLAARNRPNPLYYYATRFAGKEAVFKSLNLHPDGIRLNEIEILETDNGSPCVILHGCIRSLAESNDIQTISISLSYEDEYAIAYALAQTNK